MKFFRYLVVQVSAYGIDIGLFWVLCTFANAGALYANAAAKIVSGIACFLAHRIFTFDVPLGSSRWKQAVSYFSLLGLNIPFSSVVLACVIYFVQYELLSKFVSDVISVGFTFWLSKRFVFERKSPSDQAALDRNA
ncbi:GtrA family protein [Pseudomonas nicosulfuronedens]